MPMSQSELLERLDGWKYFIDNGAYTDDYKRCAVKRLRKCCWGECAELILRIEEYLRRRAPINWIKDGF